MEDSEKSYTRQDKFMGFFILTLLFLEHPCAQAALDLTGSRAHLQAGASSPSWHHCGEGQSPIMWTEPHHVKPPRQWCNSTGIHHGWTLSQERPALAPCRTRSRSSSRVTKCIAALRCWFYGFQSSRRPSQKVQSKNQSAKSIWFRCSRPWLHSHVWETPKEHA